MNMNTDRTVKFTVSDKILLRIESFIVHMY